MDKKVYGFYDYDDFLDKDYNICGEDHKRLIKTCCKYSSVVSFIVMNVDETLLEKLSPFEVPRPENVVYDYSYFAMGKMSNELCGDKFYRVCDELCELLLEITDNIFSWLVGWGYSNPEDPTFYRTDGSMFFTSSIHEGEIVLLPRDDEDVDDIIAQEGWIEGVRTVIWEEIP